MSARLKVLHTTCPSSKEDFALEESKETVEKRAMQCCLSQEYIMNAGRASPEAASGAQRKEWEGYGSGIPEGPETEDDERVEGVSPRLLMSHFSDAVDRHAPSGLAPRIQPPIIPTGSLSNHSRSNAGNDTQEMRRS